MSDVIRLEYRGVTMRFTDAAGKSLTAVQNVSLAVRDGEVVSLIGPSGCGKSTTSTMVMRLIDKTDGVIMFDGEDIGAIPAKQFARLPMRKRIQMVFQDPQSALNPRRRVASIVTQPLEAAGHSTWEERLAKAGLLLREIGLPPEAATRFPAQLSGGQRQRVNIARALCAVPRILIADEIVSGLDVSVQAQLLNLLAALRRERGFSMLFISHDLSIVRHISDQVAVMYLGKIVEMAGKEEIYTASAHPYTKSLMSAVPVPDPDVEAQRQRIILKGDLPNPESMT